jgi:hypothetical protein
MGRPGYTLLASCMVLFALPLGGAAAQESQWKTLDLKPLLPPVLPPSAQVAPGTLSQTTTPGDLPAFSKSQEQTSPVGGLRITIPTNR